jgi:hypothetical protein
MSSVVISGDTSGTVSLTVPSVAGTNTATLPAATGTVMVSGNMPAFSYYLAGTQSISANTATKVTFDTKEFDTNNNFASSRFTPTVAGYYQVSTNLGGVSNAYYIVADVYKNGSIYKRLTNSATSAASSVGGSCLVYCNGSTDYVEIYIFTNGGQTLGGTPVNNWFQGVLVRSA